VAAANYSANDNFKINVDWDWGFGQEVQDYTVRVYSKHSVDILDDKGETNMLHMDGVNTPSGFK